ncbi:Universal stress protein [Balamuthia mandrillaris]
MKNEEGVEQKSSKELKEEAVESGERLKALLQEEQGGAGKGCTLWMVGFDGSPQSFEALSHCLHLADPERRDRISLVSVLERHSKTSRENLKPQVDRAKEMVREWASRRQPNDPSEAENSVEYLYDEYGERPEVGLCRMAQSLRAHYLVIGKGDKAGKVAQLLVGSISEYVVKHSPCPVLVVRGQNKNLNEEAAAAATAAAAEETKTD